MSLQHYDLHTSIYYKDISSGKEDFLEAKENLDTILRCAPYGSNCRLNVLAEQGMFKGVLEVSSKEKIFRIEHQASSIGDLQKFLFFQMNEDLNQWKKNRSAEDITGIVKLSHLKSK